MQNDALCILARLAEDRSAGMMADPMLGTCLLIGPCRSSPGTGRRPTSSSPDRSETARQLNSGQRPRTRPGRPATARGSRPGCRTARRPAYMSAPVSIAPNAHLATSHPGRIRMVDPLRCGIPRTGCPAGFGGSNCLGQHPDHRHRAERITIFVTMRKAQPGGTTIAGGYRTGQSAANFIVCESVATTSAGSNPSVRNVADRSSLIENVPG